MSGYDPFLYVEYDLPHTSISSAFHLQLPHPLSFFILLRIEISKLLFI